MKNGNTRKKKAGTTLTTHVDSIRALAERIGRPVRLMEVCGTHTMAAFRTGFRSLLPPGVSLLSGPGCPVCVTTVDYIDLALAIAKKPDTIIATFGDMVRVPGTELSLEEARARGVKVAVVYSPMDALDLAARQPGTRVVFLGVGFETTTPSVAWTIKHAKETGVRNFSVLCAHKLIPPAMAALLKAGDVKVDGFMCPGHVSVIIGSGSYEFICRDYHIPCVIAGFEAADMAAAVEMLLRQVVEKRAQVENQYSRSVDAAGNDKARAAMNEVFEPCDASWRGLGMIPGSGLRIRPAFAEHDAARAAGNVKLPAAREPAGCICGAILKGTRTPPECPLFGAGCTPESPIGACMVSSEGTCAAYYKYRRKAACDGNREISRGVAEHAEGRN